VWEIALTSGNTKLQFKPLPTEIWDPEVKVIGFGIAFISEVFDVTRVARVLAISFWKRKLGNF
jgi:hypothetical protein